MSETAAPTAETPSSTEAPAAETIGGTGALVHREKTNSLALAGEMFTAEEQAAIASFVGVQPEDPALMPYLAICAKWGLDPVAGQIWLIETKVKGRDGNPDTYRKRPAVGRDGYLAIANSTPGYRGMHSGVVCALDVFEVEHDTANPDSPRILHRYRSKPTEGEEANSRYRGPVIGAWAKVLMEGRPATYFFASIREYGKFGQDRNTGESYAKGSWGYASAMILKAAQSNALRIAIGITGTAPADEMIGEHIDAEGAREEPAGLQDIEQAIVNALDSLDLPQDLVGELLEALLRVNELDPFSWAGAKVSMRLVGRSESEAREVLEEVRRDIARAEQRAADAEARAADEQADAEAAAEQPVADAEVIVIAEDVEQGQTLKLDDGVFEVTDVAESEDEHMIRLSFGDRTVDVPADREFVLLETE